MTCGVAQGSIIALLLFSLVYAPTKSNNEKEPNWGDSGDRPC